VLTSFFETNKLLLSLLRTPTAEQVPPNQYAQFFPVFLFLCFVLGQMTGLLSVVFLRRDDWQVICTLFSHQITFSDVETWTKLCTMILLPLKSLCKGRDLPAATRTSKKKERT
jgi:hypothetical protein